MDDESTTTSEPVNGGDADDAAVVEPRAQRRAGGLLTIPLLCLGLAAIGACVIIPQADANRRLAYERDRLAADLNQINQQTSLNEKFLAETENDPQLAQRLAQRQMKFIRQGESLLDYKPVGLHGSSANPKPAGASLPAAEVSPFSLIRVPPPPPQAPYQVADGVAAALLDSHIRLYCLTGGLFLVAMALVLGSNKPDVPVTDASISA